MCFTERLAKGIHPDSDQGSPLRTPDQKSGQQKLSHPATSPSSGSGSSDFSRKEGTEVSSSSLSSDSETEYYNSSIKNYSGSMSKVNGEGFMDFPGAKKKQQEEDDSADSLEARKNGSYEDLVGRVAEYEEKLRVSEEEIARLKDELHTQIESAQRDIKMRDADLESENKLIVHLQNQVTELERHVSESDLKIIKLSRELELTKEKLRGAEEEIERLNAEDIALLNARIVSEKRNVSELEERLSKYERDLSVRDDEIQELKITLSDAQENFALEKAQLQVEISGLLDKHTVGNERIKELESQCQKLEEKLWKSEVETMETVDFYDRREKDIQEELSRLLEEVAAKDNQVESLKKNLEIFKLKNHVLTSDKEELTDKVDTLIEEASSREDRLKELKEQMQKERTDLISGLEASQKLVDELRLRVTELETEVDKQKTTISDRDEEKKEAIRQLCFSLDHYRSGYKELREAVLVFKQRAVMAA